MGFAELHTVDVVKVHASVTESSAPIANNPDAVAGIARSVLPTDREGFAVLHVDSRNRVRSIELVSIGTLNASMVHPREVFKAAILANANGIILTHNHPSGDPTPSHDDHAITKRIVKAGEILGIEVLDHVIVGGDSLYSFRNNDHL